MALSAQSRTNSGSPQRRVFGGDLTNKKHVAFGSPVRVVKPKECPRSDTKVRKVINNTTCVTIDGQSLVIKEGILHGANAGTFSFRCQSHETNMQDFKDVPKEAHWDGTYSAATPQHALGYIDATSPVAAFTEVRSSQPKLKFLEVEGAFMTDPTITSDVKAEMILQHHFGELSQGVPLSRVLTNMGFDIYIGPDSGEDVDSPEGVIMNPSQFTSTCKDVFKGQPNGFGMVSSYRDQMGQPVSDSELQGSLLAKFDEVARASVLLAAVKVR